MSSIQFSQVSDQVKTTKIFKYNLGTYHGISILCWIGSVICGIVAANHQEYNLDEHGIKLVYVFGSVIYDIGVVYY